MAALIVVVLILCGTGSMVIYVINLHLANANRKVPISKLRRLFQMEILYIPALLNERGLVARRRAIYGFAGFIVCWIAVMAVGLSTGILQ